jgi:hypothetical protein
VGKCKIGICNFSKYEFVDKYCLFHEPNKNDWGYEEKEKFKKEIKNYIEKQKILGDTIEFKNLYFVEVDWSELLKDLKSYKIVFKKCIFLENSRFDNIKCKCLIFEDCRFKDGGGIKNRGKENNLNIQKLVLKIYELNGDFVVDLGKSAGKNVFLDKNSGKIEEIIFENPQKGNGRVFFIGLNEKLKKGDFKNRILDKVVFENCDLRNCYFLNSKIDDTEFRNVLFPEFSSRFFGLKDILISIFVIIITIITAKFVIEILEKIAQSKNIDLSLMWLFVITVFVILIIMLFSFLDYIFIFLLDMFSIFNRGINKHLGTKDEEQLLHLLRKTGVRKNFEEITALKNLYDQFVINFNKDDKQLAGKFIYSSKFYQSLAFFRFNDALNGFVSRSHHFINGYGQKWFRGLWHMIFTIFIFALIFTYNIKPNESYIATVATPKFLILKEQGKKKILDTTFKVGLYKSFSNLFFPVNLKTNKWFENKSEKSFILSYLEAVLLWVFTIGFVKALWNNMKF